MHWIDQFQYTIEHPDEPKCDKVFVGFCPEGYYKPGDVIRNGQWTKTVVKVVPRIKKANEHLERKWADLWVVDDKN